ncbi:MAG: hypothetical protein RIS36_1803 [Pseudomonadota bacterium]|jgi:esterase/lipase
MRNRKSFFTTLLNLHSAVVGLKMGHLTTITLSFEFSVTSLVALTAVVALVSLRELGNANANQFLHIVIELGGVPQWCAALRE